MQPRPPQIHRPRPHRHQLQPTTTIAHLLRKEEVSPSRPASQEDPSDQEAVEQARVDDHDGEAEEEVDTFPAKEVCCEGTLGSTLALNAGNWALHSRGFAVGDLLDWWLIVSIGRGLGASELRKSQRALELQGGGIYVWLSSDSDD